MELAFDSPAIMIIMNMSGWIVVGYFMRDYLQENRSIKDQLHHTLKQYNEIRVQQSIHTREILFLEKSIQGIADHVANINDTLESNNRALIQELKMELKNLKGN